jgi:hypothetical protein
MPVTVDYYDEAHSIIIQRVIGNWTTQDALEIAARFRPLAQQIEGRFDVITDFLEAAYTPPVGILWEWKQIVQELDNEFTNWGTTVWAVKSGVFKAFFEEGVQTTEAIRKHYRLAKTVDQAIQIIQADRCQNCQST